MKINIDRPLISVMMPVYNGILTLPIAIESLIIQTYTNWRCVIVNDGSVDGTKEYLDSLVDERFKIIHFDKNKGRPYARQAALEACEGQYLAYLDADDFYHPEKLKKQLEVLENNPTVDLISCGMGSFDSKFELLSVKGKRVHKPTIYRMIQNYYPARAACMIRLERAKKIDYNLKLKYAQDTDYFTRYINGKKYMVTADILYYYSEFTSVNISKVLNTYIHGVNRGISIMGHHFLAGIKLVVLSLLKWCYISVKSRFVDHESFIKSRGQKPSLIEQEDFKEVLKLLNLS